GIRDFHVTGVQTCALPISAGSSSVAVRSAAAEVVVPIGLDCQIVAANFRFVEPAAAGNVPVQYAIERVLPAPVAASVDTASDSSSEERRVGKVGRGSV